MAYCTIGTAAGSVGILTYVKGIKAAKANLEKNFKHGLSTWYPVTGKDIVRQFRVYVHDAINIRGGLIMRGFKMSRYERKARETVVLPECRNCTNTVPRERFNPNNRESWFCSDSCRKDHY